MVRFFLVPFILLAAAFVLIAAHFEPDATVQAPTVIGFVWMGILVAWVAGVGTAMSVWKR